MAKDETEGSQETATIAVMGGTGTGKSSFINLASASHLQVGDGLRSCTSTMNESQSFDFGGYRVTLIDTPGFDDSVMSDTDILRIIGAYLEKSFEQGHKLRGIIYMHRISDVRMGGAARKNFRMFQKLCGDKLMENVRIVTNMWGDVAPEIGEQREHELMTDDVLFKPVIDKGARMLRHVGTQDSARSILYDIITNNEPKSLRIQEELVIERKDITETDACQELDRELEEARKRYEQEIKELQEQMEEALREKDLETKEELERVRRDLEETTALREQKRKNLSLEYAVEKKRVGVSLEQLIAVVNATTDSAEDNLRHIDRDKTIHKVEVNIQDGLSAKQVDQIHGVDEGKSPGHRYSLRSRSQSKDRKGKSAQPSLPAHDNFKQGEIEREGDEARGQIEGRLPPESIRYQHPQARARGESRYDGYDDVKAQANHLHLPSLSSEVAAQGRRNRAPDGKPVLEQKQHKSRDVNPRAPQAPVTPANGGRLQKDIACAGSERLSTNANDSRKLRSEEPASVVGAARVQTIAKGKQRQDIAKDHSYDPPNPAPHIRGQSKSAIAIPQQRTSYLQFDVPKEGTRQTNGDAVPPGISSKKETRMRRASVEIGHTSAGTSYADNTADPTQRVPVIAHNPPKDQSSSRHRSHTLPTSVHSQSFVQVLPARTGAEHKTREGDSRDHSGEPIRIRMRTHSRLGGEVAYQQGPPMMQRGAAYTEIATSPRSGKRLPRAREQNTEKKRGEQVATVDPPHTNQVPLQQQINPEELRPNERDRHKQCSGASEEAWLTAQEYFDNICKIEQTKGKKSNRKLTTLEPVQRKGKCLGGDEVHEEVDQRAYETDREIQDGEKGLRQARRELKRMQDRIERKVDIHIAEVQVRGKYEREITELKAKVQQLQEVVEQKRRNVEKKRTRKLQKRRPNAHRQATHAGSTELCSTRSVDLDPVVHSSGERG